MDHTLFITCMQAYNVKMVCPVSMTMKKSLAKKAQFVKVQQYVKTSNYYAGLYIVIVIL